MEVENFKKYPDEFILYHPDFDEIVCEKSNLINHKTSEPLYVPKEISCVKNIVKPIIENMPTEMKNRVFTKQTLRNTDPEILSQQGLMSRKDYEKQLSHQTSLPTLYLPYHPMVPINENGFVDVDAIFEMNRLIASLHIDLQYVKQEPFDESRCP